MTTTSNTELWDKLKRVPPDQLKGFSRAGGFKGTAIKPMWSFHKMTEVFGPVGQGWRMGEPLFQTVEGQNNEILVFCTVSVIVDGASFYGVGGDKVVKYIAPNEQYNRPARWENDDEAYKKAYTDALTNALKLLGVGADIHMGLWDGNKYVDDVPEPAPKPTPPASKAASRDAYEAMVKTIRDTSTLKALEEWRAEYGPELDKLPPDWFEELKIEYVDRKAELKRNLAT